MLLACSCVCTVVSNAESGNAKKYVLNIPSNVLGKSLLQLARETGFSIVFSTQTTDNLESTAIEGSYGFEEALKILLGEACLSLIKINAQLYSLRPGCTVPAEVTEKISASVISPPSTQSHVEEIVVLDQTSTGSRIRFPKPGYGPNVEVITRSDIESSSNQDVGNLLRLLTLVAGNPTSTLVTNGGDGTSTITLRGLPASNTLVLLNGRRINGVGMENGPVDLNSIPLGVIERIEILKDGASALYGSDAIAGVVNLITRTPVNEITGSSFYGVSSRGDLGTLNSSLLLGKVKSNQRFSLGLSYYEQKPLFSRDRTLSSSSDDRAKGGVDKRSSATAPSIVFLRDGFLTLNPGSDGANPKDFRTVTDEDKFDYREFTSAIVPSRRWSLFSQYGLDTDSGINFYLESLYTNTRSINTLAPTPLFTILHEFPVSPNSEYNPFGEPLFDVRRRFTELGPRITHFDSRSLRTVVGSNGTYGKYHWDISYSHNRSRGNETLQNLLHAPSVQRSLESAAVCIDDCVALNLLGPVGSINQDMLNFIVREIHNRSITSLNSLILNVDFPLFQTPAGMVEFATGFEFRKERLHIDPDFLVLNFETIGGVNFPKTKGKRQVREVYLESYIPILKDVFLAKRLNMQLALRLSSYTNFGYTSNPRVSLNYIPVQSFLVRSSYSQAFRAPSLLELKSGEKETFIYVDDPCSDVENVELLLGCTQQSDPSLNQFATIQGGNLNLKPERAETYTVGLQWKPAFISGLVVSADWYQIKEEDVIGGSPDFIVNENARSLGFADRIKRDENGNILQIVATQINIGERNLSGLDFAIEYLSSTFNWGRIKFKTSATHLLSFKERIDPLKPFEDLAGTFKDAADDGRGALPDWKLNLALNLENKRWNLGYNFYYVSTLREEIPRTSEKRTIDAWRTHNAQLVYKGPRTMNTKVTLGMRNIFDEAPPFVARAFNDSYDSRTYDITGRFLYLRLEKTL